MTITRSNIGQQLKYQSGGLANLPTPERHPLNERPIFRALMAAENSVLKGFDPERDIWFPHESLERGRPTIAYGHKLGSDEDFSRGISESEAIDLFMKDFEEHENIAKRGFGSEDFDKLPQKYKDVLTNIVFNIGSFDKKEWPNLTKALKTGDEPRIRKEMVTSYFDPNKKKRIQLKDRAKLIADALGLKENDNNV